MKKIDLSIIIVHYLNDLLTFNCIKSINKNILIDFYEIIIIDNSPTDSFRRTLLENNISVVYFHMGKNSGFGQANNKGLELANGEFILLLNNDTIFHDDSLDKAVDYYRKNNWASKKGILTIKQANINGDLNFSAYPCFPDIKKWLKANPFVIWMSRILLHERNFENKKMIEFHSTSHIAKWVAGSFMLFPKSLMYNNTPFFDVNFFMYSEDVEVCHRLYKMGYRHYYYKDASFVHLDGGSSNNSKKRIGQIFLSELLYLRKSRGRIYFMLVVILIKLNFSFDSYLVKRKACELNSNYIYIMELLSQYWKKLFFLKDLKKQFKV